MPFLPEVLGETGSKKLASRTFRMADFQSLDVWLWKWVHQKGLSVLIRASWWPLYVCMNYAGNCIPLLWTHALPCFAPMCFNLRPDRQEDWEILFRIFTPSGGASTGPPSGRDPELRHCAKTDFKAAKEKAQTYKLIGGFVSFHCLSTNINCNQLEN